MKPSGILKSGFVLAILNGGIASGQDVIPVSINNSPFSKGNTYHNLSNDLSLSWKKLETDNISAGNRNKFGMNYKGTYFILDGVGVGLGFESDRNKETFGETETTTITTIGSAHAVYGQELGGVMNIYGKVEVRAGVDKSKYKSDLYSQDTKHNDFGLNFEIGAPLSLGNVNGIYFTPFLAYDYFVRKDDNYKDIYSGLYLGTRLNLSLPCGSFAHNCSQVRDFSENMYAKGTNVIGGFTSFKLNLGTEKFMYTGDNGNGSDDPKNSVSGGSAKAEYYRYLVDNIAFGGELRVRTSAYKNNDTDNKQNSFSWMINPILQVNLPVTGELHNTFAFAGYEYGRSMDKTTYSEVTTKTVENKSSVSFGAGYNIFFAKGFALVPVVNYAWSTSKNIETEVKHKRSGFETGISIRYSY